MLQKNISRDLATIQQIILPDPVHNFSRVNLARLPTPLQEALRFSKSLSGPDIYIKRDDLTGLAGGGNKTRKLEFLIGQALEQDADCVITAGAPQSNHCRQTAAAAAQCGLECHLVFGGASESVIEGNYFLDQLLGAKFHWTVRQLREKKMNEVAEALRAEGKKPFVIPVGGSNAVGAIGYVAAMFEIMEQLATTNLQIDHIVFATSSGGTQAGLVVGAYMAGFRGKITGISIDQEPDETCDFKYKDFVLDLANSAAQMLDVNHKFESEDIEINYHYLGKGYGVVGELEQEAIPLLARTEGILVGPVYTGRALGGLIDMIRTGSITNKQNVLFWHTGDDITLHAHVSDFT